jgi:antitoxin (DNA-binding transcriptional repressor) of toxin-antitoxin stability system
MTKAVDIQEAKEQLSELVSLALAGAEVLITDGEKPVARLVPVSSPGKKRIAGLHKGAMTASDDFDDPLPDEFWFGKR